jgi:hypothetical protein
VFTQADVDALDAAQKTGAKTIRTADGRTITNPPVAEYFVLRQFMLNEIAGAAGQPIARLLHAGHQTGVE